jgi:hypothetical protein
MSLREHLSKISEPEPGKSIQIPHGFGSFPVSGSLGTAMEAMNSPRINEWSAKYEVEDNFNNHEWTQECQGLTTDGTSWYIVSNNNSHRAIHRFGLDWSHTGDVVYPYTDMVDGEDKSHIGDPDCYNGKIYVPVEDTKEARVWVLDTNLTSLGRWDLGSHDSQKAKNPWLAINPWNQFLYSSIFGDPKYGEQPVSRLYAYDLEKFEYHPEKDIILKDKFFHRVQGGCFSENGHVFLTSDDDTHSIHAYSSLNGHYYGSCWVPSDWSDGEELEGMAIYPLIPVGKPYTIHVHVIVLDVDIPSKDDVFIKHFTVPDPKVL